MSAGTEGQRVIAGSELPQIFVAADRRSQQGQRLALLLRAAQLMLLVVAALLAVVPFNYRGIEWGTLGAGIAFAAAFLTEATILSTQPDKTWYQCRAIAETIKSLSWRYAVGGNPFAMPHVSRAAPSDARAPDDPKAVGTFSRRLHQLLNDFSTSGLIPTEAPANEITQWMVDLRKSGFEARRATYHHDRIAGQHQWYARKAEWNRKRSIQWSIGLLAVQIAGMAGAILKGTGVIHIDLLGVMSAVAASAVAWLQIKQHSTLYQSYSQAATELSAIGAELTHVDEPGWATFVDQAEQAISREHTAWLAKRG